MKKKVIQYLKKYFFIGIALTLAISVTLTVYAEFTKSEKAKRVVSAYPSPGKLFTSDYLRASSTGEISNYASVFLSDEDVAKLKNNESVTRPEITINLYNYVHSNPSLYYSRNIPYTLTASLVNSDGTPYTGDYDATIQNITLNKDNTSHIFNSTISGNALNSDSYNVSFDPHLYFEQSVFLEVVVEQTNHYPDIDTYLTARINVTELPTAANEGWSITPTDNRVIGDNDNSSDYYGYNYRVSGNGSGNVKVSWDNTKIMLSESVMKDMNITKITDGKTSYISIDVDSATVNSYDLQFFPVIQNDASVVQSWEDVKVTCVFSPSDDENSNNEP